MPPLAVGSQGPLRKRVVTGSTDAGPQETRALRRRNRRRSWRGSHAKDQPPLRKLFLPTYIPYPDPSCFACSFPLTEITCHFFPLQGAPGGQAKRIFHPVTSGDSTVARPGRHPRAKPAKDEPTGTSLSSGIRCRDRRGTKHPRSRSQGSSRSRHLGARPRCRSRCQLHGHQDRKDKDSGKTGADPAAVATTS